jgi:beta-fructofuranosidase
VDPYQPVNQIRFRPSAHFAPRRGWVNDPYGIYWDGRQYHLYFQAIADQATWAPQCSWGHAVSADLTTWQEKSIVLTPQPFEVGCWSGCVVPDASGIPRAFYTRVQLPDLDLGSIAVARFDESGKLSSQASDVVVDPPEDLSVTAFRDPYIIARPDGWTMIVGGGTADGAGAVFQYRSDDLDRWRFAGILCRGRVDSQAPAARQVWECPQLVLLGEVWVLVVSVQLDGGAGPVMAAVGDYSDDGFSVRRWQRLACGPAPYATSLFRDRDNRACMISWLREGPGQLLDVPAWAGAESLVAELRLDPTGAVAAVPHPTYAGVFTELSPGAAPLIHNVDLQRAAHLTAAAGEAFEVDIQVAGRHVGRVGRATGATSVLIEQFHHAPESLAGSEPSAGVEVFFDADILEIFTGGAYGAWRLG